MSLLSTRITSPTPASSGQGEKNYAGSSANTATGWVGVGTVSVTTDNTAADLPRANTTKTGIKFTPSGGASGTFTCPIASPGVFTATAHGMKTGYAVTFTATVALPTPLVAGTPYYVNVLSANTFNVATSMANLLAGVYVNITAVGTGTLSYAYGLGYLRFTLDAADYNVKLKTQLAQNILSGATGDWGVDVYSNTASDYSGTYTRLPLSTDSAGSTALPNLEGTFRSTFDAPGAAAQYIELRFNKLAANTHALVGSDLIVGPGVVVQGAARSSLGNQYSPTINGQSSNPSLGTGSCLVSWERDGDEMLLVGTVQSIGGTIGSGEYTIPLPTGYNINYAAYGSNSGKNVAIGVCVFIAGFTGTGATYTANAGAGYTDYIRLSFGGNSWSSTNFSLATNQQLTFSARVPISQWAGSGTVNVAQNDVEYAYNTSTATNANDTTSFGYGPGGALIGSITSALSRTVRFQSPLQQGDQLIVQVSADQQKWSDVTGYGAMTDGNNRVGSFAVQSTATYGMGNPYFANATDVVVAFGQYAYPAGATFASAGSTWASGAGAYYWRVKKTKAGAAVGFGIVQPGVASGLVSASGVPGNTTGNAIASGYVGQQLTASPGTAQNAAAAGTWSSPISISVGPGVFLIRGMAALSASGITGGTNVLMGISTVSGNNAPVAMSTATSGYDGSSQYQSGLLYVNVSTPTTYYLQARVDCSSIGTATWSTSTTIEAVRIA